LGLSHNTLTNYYQIVFELSQSPRWKFSLTEIENMMPYELDVYATLMKSLLNEERNL